MVLRTIRELEAHILEWRGDALSAPLCSSRCRELDRPNPHESHLQEAVTFTTDPG